MVNKLLLSFLCVLLLTGFKTVSSQFRVQHQAPTVIERQQPVRLEFSVPGINPDQVQEASVFYRSDGDVSYKRNRAEMNRDIFHTSLSVDKNAGSLEYYFIAELTDGSRITYPNNNPKDNPVQVQIVESPDRKSHRWPLADKIKYTILSPEPNGKMTQGDALVAITFFYDNPEIEKGEFKLKLDGEDITEKSKASAYFLSYVPKNIAEGKHNATVTYSKGDSTAKIATWDFSVVNVSQLVSRDALVEGSGNSFSGQVQVGARNQVISGQPDNATRGKFRVSGNYGLLQYRVNGLLTSQESPRLQPQNRYGAELRYGKWIDLKAGHFYPTLSRITLAGRRVRGVYSGIHLANRNINVQFLYGRLNRRITNIYKPIQASLDTVAVYSSGGAVVDSSFSLGFQDRGRGMYRRNIMGGRVSFGNGRHIQWGVNALKVEDDTTSISPIQNFNDLITLRPTLAQGLNAKEKNWLQSHPDQLQVNGSNPKPEGNVMAGTDLSINMDKDRIQLDAEGAASLLNQDISGGVLTQQKAEDLGIDLNNDVENMLSRLSWLIIINEQMNTLPFKFKQKADGTRELQPFVPRSIFAGQSRLSLNYLRNNLKLQYRWIGPDYNSLANSTIRRDIAGYTLSDRLRWFNNQLYFTMGYEQLQDNVINNQEATTTTNTMRSNVSWYPIKRSLPRLSVGMKLRTRDNGVQRSNPFLSGEKKYAAIRNVRQVAADSAVVLPDPRSNNTIQLSGSVTQQFKLFNIINDASVNYMFMKTDDQVFNYGNTNSQAYSFSLKNRYNNLPLNTNFAVSYNDTKSVSGLSEIKITGINVGSQLYLLENKLQLSTDLALTINKSTSQSLGSNDNNTPGNYLDDYYAPKSGQVKKLESNSYIIRGGAKYNITSHHAILVNMSYTNVVNQVGPGAISNDQLLEARYIYSF